MFGLGYVFLILENMLCFVLLMFSDRCSSLLVFLMNLYFLIRVMCRLIVVKVLKLIFVVMGFLISLLLLVGWDVVVVRFFLEVLIMVFIFVGLIWVIRGWNGFSWWLVSRVWWLV